MSRLSVIIANYNYAHYLEECLNSLAVQTLPSACWDVWVVDDGSSDASCSVVDAWLREHVHIDGHLLQGRHLGHPGLVRNRGISLAQGPWRVCLDADDYLEPVALEVLLKAAVEQENSMGGGHCIVAPDYTEMEEGVKGHVVHVPPFDPQLVRHQHPCNNAICYQRVLWQLLGGYNGANVYEDWDFLLRAVGAGARWFALGQAVHVYRRHGQGVTAGAVPQDAKAKADMVLRSPGLFPASVLWWARKVQEGAPWVYPFPRGYIPGHAHLCQWHGECVQRMGKDAQNFFPVQIFGK